MEQPKQLKTCQNIRDVPTKYQDRLCSDVLCIWIAAIFTLVMIVSSVIAFDYSTFLKVNFPADSEGRLCGIEFPFYPYVYFTQLPKINKRVCVSKCPQKGSAKLDCMPTSDISCRFSNTNNYQVLFYESQQQYNRNGYFCMPKQQSLNQKLRLNSKLSLRDKFYNSKDGIIICALLAIGLSVFYFLLVQFFPKIMNYVAIIGGIVAIIGTFILIVTYPSSNIVFKIVIGFALVTFCLICLGTMYFSFSTMKIHTVFLENATKIIEYELSVVSYLVLFILVLLVFVVLILFEFLAFWTMGNAEFDAQYIYWQLSGKKISSILSILVAIQAIWGLNFIKQAFNFCISSVAVQWYYSNHVGYLQPLELLLFKHLGSVIAGSFMTGFFSILDFILDFVKPSFQSRTNQNCYYKCYSSSFSCCSNISDLVRSDAMAYINLYGNPYCNSSRNCQLLCDSSDLLDDSQATSRIYRVCSHFLIAGIITAISLYIKGQVFIETTVFVMVLTMFICTFFISLHADGAEAIKIIILAQQHYNSHSEIKHQPIRKQITDQIFNSRAQQQRQNHQINQEIIINNEVIQNNQQL